MIRMMKDADRLIECTYDGAEDITNANITWALVPQWEPDWTNPIDATITAEAVVTKTTAAAEVVITDGPAGEFDVTISRADTAALAIGQYWAIARIETQTGSHVNPPAELLILIAYTEWRR